MNEHDHHCCCCCCHHEEGWLAYGLGPAFYLTAATVDLSAAPNVTPGLAQMSDGPMGPALTYHSAPMGPEEPIGPANLKLWSAKLGDEQWAVRDQATSELARLGRQYPGGVWAAIAPQLRSGDPDVRMRAAYVKRGLRPYLAAGGFRTELAGLRQQRQRVRRAF